MLIGGDIKCSCISEYGQVHFIEKNKILLTVFNDPIRGIVYNLPAGGTESKQCILRYFKVIFIA